MEVPGLVLLEVHPDHDAEEDRDDRHAASIEYTVVAVSDCLRLRRAETAGCPDELANHDGMRRMGAELESKVMVAYWKCPWWHEWRSQCVHPAIESVD